MQALKRIFSTKMSQKLNFPAADRNKGPILEVLQKYFDSTKPGKVLEISSGTGQQVSFYAQHFPLLEFQPSEYDQTLFDSIRAYIADTPTKNIKDPIYINASDEWDKWNLTEGSFDYAINVNMIHVTPFPCTVGLFTNVSKALKPDGILVTYGAYAIDGVLEPQSNRDFDKQIRKRDPNCGIRDVRDVEKVAQTYGIVLRHIHDMPANNKCVVWQRTD